MSGISGATVLVGDSSSESDLLRRRSLLIDSSLSWISVPFFCRHFERLDVLKVLFDDSGIIFDCGLERLFSIFDSQTFNGNP